MERRILRGSYWLGMVSLVVSFLWKALNAFGAMLPAHVGPNSSITYTTFYKASILFFVAAIASTSYETLKSQR